MYGRDIRENIIFFYIIFYFLRVAPTFKNPKGHEDKKLYDY